jgi:hypothetical protein
MTKRIDETYQEWYARTKEALSSVRQTAEYKERHRQASRKYDGSHKEQQKQYYRNNKHVWRRGELRRRYGMTVEQFETLFVLQGNRCAICHVDKPTTKKGWVVDHDHVTGKVRGILCGKCNSAIGYLGDSPALLNRAAKYLGGN